MEVALNTNFIVMVLHGEHKTLTEMLSILDGKRIDEPEFEQELSRKYPEHFKFIMLDEEYGQFFAEGSPQMEECGWTFQLTVKKEYTEIKIFGIK